jgi:hypothetical protein
MAMNPKNFLAELKRRNVYKVAITYRVVDWLLTEIATQVFSATERFVERGSALGDVAWAILFARVPVKREPEQIP